MRSNKLRLAALAMSFVMAATAVPSVAFAEDLFTSDEAVSEEVAFDDGAEFVEEPVVDFVEPEAAEEFYETAPIAASEEGTGYELVGENVHFFFDEKGYEDYTVTYNPSSVDNPADLLYTEDKLLVDDKNVPVHATKIEEAKDDPAAGKCTGEERFKLQVIINFGGKDQTFISKEFKIAPKDHEWGDVVSHTVQPSCTAVGYTADDQQCKVCEKWRMEEDSAYAATVKADETKYKELPKTAHTPAGGPYTTGYYTSTDAFDPNDPDQAAYNSELDDDGIPKADNPAKNWRYQIVEFDTCTVCGEKIKVNVIETVTKNGEETGEPFIDNVTGIKNKDALVYDGSSSNYLTIDDEDIELENCFKDGSYDVVMYRTDLDTGKLVKDLIDTKVVSAPHHMPATIQILTDDGKDTELAKISLLPNEDTGKVEAKKADDFPNAQKVGLSVVYTEEGELIVTNLSCKDPYKYKKVLVCSHNEDKDGKIVDKDNKSLPFHEISTESIEAPANGPHIIDEDMKKDVANLIEAGKGTVSYDDLEELVGDYHPDKAPQTDKVTKLDANGNPVLDKDGNEVKEDRVDNANVSIRLGTADCENDGTVFVDYSCLVCKKVIETKEVNVTKLGHAPADKAVVEYYNKPSCTEDGSYEANIYCERCNKLVTSKKVTVEALGHDYGDKFVLGHLGKLIVGRGYNVSHDYKVGDDVEAFLGSSRVVYLLAGAVCKRCEKSAIENEEPTSIVYDYEAGEYTINDTYTNPATGETTVIYKPAEGKITKIVPGPHYCEEKLLTVEFSYEEKGDKQTATEEFPYYPTALDFQGRTPHQPGTAVPEHVVPATETTEGSYESVVYCELCGHEISRTLVPVPVTTHEHTWEPVEAKEATCTEPGNKEYYFCEACGSYSLDGVEICAQTETVIPAEHKYEEVEEVPATCTEAGVKKHVICSVCEKKFIIDEEAGVDKEVESDEELAIPALGHELEKVESKAPTASEEGNIEYYICTRCGKLFSDAEGTTETTEEEVKLPKLELPAKVTGVKTNAYPSDVYPSKGFMKVTWTAVEGADDYRVSYRALGETAWTKVLTGGANSITLDETALTVGTSYEIRVAAGKEGVFGPRSDVLRRYYESVTPTYTRTSDSISVTWPAVEKGSSYMVIYSENKSMKPYKTIIVRNGILSATLKNLKAGTKYYVRVRPYDKTGKTATGALSPLKCVTTKK